MKVKMIIALAAVAIATVAGASTNYVEVLKKNNLTSVVNMMTKDPELADADRFRRTLEDFDATAATFDKVNGTFWTYSRCCSKTVKAILDRGNAFGPKAREALCAVCGYDAENRPIMLQPNEDGYVNYALEAACAGIISPDSARSGILTAAIVPTRRMIRKRGGSFVGPAGGKLVKSILDALANELNAPRFGNADDILADIGIEIEWEFIQSRILGDADVAEIRIKLLDGEIPFDGAIQNKLCIAMGVVAYNEFVREYNGKRE